MIFTFHIRFSLTQHRKMSFWLQGQDGQSVDVAEVSILYLSKFMYCTTIMGYVYGVLNFIMNQRVVMAESIE